MPYLRHTVLSIALIVAAFGAGAQTATADQPAAEPAAPAAKPASPADQRAAMEKQMKAMREMHEKWANAKTAQERQALRAEHMKTMQEGMNLMGGMGAMAGRQTMPGDMRERHRTMETRMDMMQSMMQMMMDHLPAEPAK